MAATLVAIKARMLLPRTPKNISAGEEEGPDPREELVLRLLEYQKFKEVADYLKGQERQVGKVYTRHNSAEMYQHLFKPRDPLGGISIDKLLNSLQQVLKKAGAQLSVPEEITRGEISLPDKMRQVMAKLIFYPMGMPFEKLFDGSNSRSEIVVTFLAVLELLKLGQIKASQQENFGEITLLPGMPSSLRGLKIGSFVQGAGKVCSRSIAFCFQ
ncbi:hypothetical protein N752_06390 [Desulforamulus aquiferis]|nr:segregation/condensation protein A [Desulforamulus aquiferis]RYD05982.1 hypothetical protein N752_06390 [Desulforamulus aquiferis]